MTALKDTLKPYRRPDHRKSVMQLVTSAAFLIGIWLLMLQSLEWSYALTILLALPAAGIMVRLFIIQHDCGHGSFFRSRKVNDAVGSVIGVLTLTPYHYWLRTHNIHHASSGNLDRRGLGEVQTLTVEEYRALPRAKRFGYRLYRHPVVLFIVGPAYQFLCKHRLPLDAPRTWKKEWVGIMGTNIALLGIVFALVQAVGWQRFLLVQAPITLFSGTIGVWLFYVQHQFEDTYWQRSTKWVFETASVQGSSYYDLPRILHWFTGNIGFHHIHHLSSLIPNYKLAQCWKEHPELQNARRLTLLGSLRCARLKLWDEDSEKLVGFRHLRTHRAA